MTTGKLSVIGVIIILIIPLLAFVAGLIHSLVVFWYVIVVGQTLILLIPFFLIAILYYIFRLLFPKTNRPWAKLLICIAGVFLAPLEIGLSQKAGFYGLFTHYKIAKPNFETVRTWGKSVELGNDKFYCKSCHEITGPASQFRSFYVSVSEYSYNDPTRKIELMWGSSVASFDYRIIILAEGKSYKPYGIALQIAPAVYLELSH